MGADGATHFLDGEGSAIVWVAEGAAGFLIPGKSGWPPISWFKTMNSVATDQPCLATD